MKEFTKWLISMAFGLFAGLSSGTSTPTVLSMIGVSHGFEGLGIIVGILVLAFSFNGLKSLLDGINDKSEKKG